MKRTYKNAFKVLAVCLCVVAVVGLVGSLVKKDSGAGGSSGGSQSKPCTEHVFSYNEKTNAHACDVCGEIENVVHKYVDNGDGTHHMTCEVCGDDVSEEHLYHYTVNADGTHTRYECDKCDYVEEKNEKHTYVYSSELNRYECVCGYGANGIKLNDSVLDLVGPEGASTFSDYCSEDLGIHVEDGIAYRSFKGRNLTSAGYSHGMNLINDDWHIDGARYIVLKVRTDMPSIRWQLHFQGGSGLVDPAPAAFTAGEWTTLVIDMSTYGHNFYKPDANGNYPGFERFLFMNWVEGTGDFTDCTVDVAYIATVRDAAGVVELVGGDNIALQTAYSQVTSMTVDEFYNTAE